MTARARILVGVAAAAVGVLAGGAAWQLLAERNTPWTRFFGSTAAPLAFVGHSRPCGVLTAPLATSAELLDVDGMAPRGLDALMLMAASAPKRRRSVRSEKQVSSVAQGR